MTTHIRTSPIPVKSSETSPEDEPSAPVSYQSVSRMFRYVISGLRVQSDVELRSALPTGDWAEPDVHIHLGAVPEVLNGGPGLAFRLVIEGIATFAILAGKEVIYQPVPGVSMGDLPIYLTGTCLAALLQQRGHLVLHASAVSVDGRAMIFCGESGAGKSTLAAMLMERGHPLLNDDVCNLKTGAHGRFSVSPDGRMLKLWKNTLDRLHQDAEGEPIRQGFDKFYTAATRSEAEGREVGAIYILELAASDAPPTLSRMAAAPSILELHKNAYRRELVDGMGQRPSYFQATARLCGRYPIYRLRRPKDFARAGDVLDLLEASWRNRGLNLHLCKHPIH